MKHLFVYEIACTNITGIDCQIFLFCVDASLRTHVLCVQDYQTSVMVYPNQADMHSINYKYENLKDRMGFVSKFIDRVEGRADYRQFCGFTNSEEVVALRFFLKHEKYRKAVVNTLSKWMGDDLNPSAEFRVKQILHKDVKPEIQFLYDTKIRLCSWIKIDNEQVSHDIHQHFNKRTAPYYVSKNFIKPLESSDLDGKPVPYAPDLRRLYIRVDAHSSLATKTSQLNPSYEENDDVVRIVTMATSDMPFGTPPIVFDIRDCKDGGEEELLHKVGKKIESLDVHAIVLASDEKCKPNSLAYLFHRAQRYNQNLHLSKIIPLSITCELRPCGKEGFYLVFNHYGTLRVDLCCILRKIIISPNLNGFTPLDALRHDKLVSEEHWPFLSKLRNNSFIETNSFSPIENVIHDMTLFVELLKSLEQSNSYLIAQQNTAQVCYLNVTDVCERGQQARVKNLFFSFFHVHHLICNDDQLKERYVILKMPRKESSYPNPEWLTNPELSTLYGPKRPGRVLKEPPLPHLSHLLDLDHNNTFAFEQLSSSSSSSASASSLSSSASSSSSMPPTLIPPPSPIIISSAQQQELEARLMAATEQKQQRKDEDEEEDYDEDEKEQHHAFKQDLEHKLHDLERGKQLPPPNASNLPVASLFTAGKRPGAAFKRKSRKKVETAEDKDRKKRFRGGLVLAPVRGFNYLPQDTLVTLDFKSLYPSIMRGYRICAMRVIYDRKWLNHPDVEVEYIPITDTECVAFAKRVRRNGVWEEVETITPKIVESVMELRAATRKKQKNFTEGTFEWNALESLQLTYKVVANSTYGFLGSSTSGMVCTALAAAITQIGQWMNQNVRYVVLFMGHACIYGDTDSTMDRFWVNNCYVTEDDIMLHILQQAQQIVSLCEKWLPHPNGVEPECFKRKMLLLKKKVYAALQFKFKKYSWRNLQEDDCMGTNYKGLSATKRDKCAFAQQVGRTMIDQLLANPTASFKTHVEWFSQRIEEFMSKKISTVEDLEPFIISCALNQDYVQDPDTVKALNLAKLVEQVSGARPPIGTRIPYVMIYNPSEKLSSKCAKTPDVCIQQNMTIDKPYYLEKQILKVMLQILSLPVHVPLYQQFQKCVERHVHRWLNSTKHIRQIDNVFKPHKKLKIASCC